MSTISVSGPCPTCKRLITYAKGEKRNYGDNRRHVCGDVGAALKKSDSYPLGVIRDADPLRK